MLSILLALIVGVVLSAGNQPSSSSKTGLAYPDITHTTSEGDTYTIRFDQKTGLPIQVIPYFPASVTDPNHACQNLYVHMMAKKSEEDRQIRVKATRVLERKGYRLAWERVTRSGLGFGCVWFDDLEGGKPRDVPWFMSCDRKLDPLYDLKIYNADRFPYSEGFCVMKKEEIKRRADIEREKRRIKEEDPKTLEERGFGEPTAQDRLFMYLQERSW